MQSLRTARGGMRLDLCAWTDSNNKPIADEYCAIFDKSNIRKRSATTGPASTQS
jgi:hypothetical protein